jgi:hypothetical protein
MTRVPTFGAVALLAGALCACKSPRYEAPYGQPPEAPAVRGAAPGELVLNRGDWLLGDQSAVFKVLAEPREGGRPVHLGYVVARRYREVRGGPDFRMYEVTTLDRDEQVGLVDSLGNAKRFTPRRGGGIDVVDLGNSHLEASVAAIFDTPRPVTLEATTERRIAFEMLDADRDGYLTPAEWPRSQGAEGDANRDGKIDWQEFDRLDRL